MNKIDTIGIDLAKNTFQVCAINQNNKVIFNKKISRKSFFNFILNLKTERSLIIGMEACGSAHQLARELIGHGFSEVKLIAGKFIKPFLKNQKNDSNDALAICEAIKRPNMRFVGIKTIEQQNIQALHRVREGLIKRRTALSNEMRGLLLEYGITIPQGVHKVGKEIVHILETDLITPFFKEILQELYDEFKSSSQKITKMDIKIKKISNEDDLCKKIQKLEGVGPIVSTAIVAAVGQARVFKHGREFSAWLGLTPRQFSTGGKTILGRISKKGDNYIRKNLIHGCRSVINNASKKEDKKSKWILEKVKNIGKNKALVALANKNARIIWALLNKNEEYIVNM